MEDYLRIGVVTGTHGLKGEVKVFPTTDEVDRFKKIKKVYCVIQKGVRTQKEEFVFEIESARQNQKFILLKFKGYDHINDVEFLKQQDLLITREQSSPLREHENFIVDLIGLMVINHDNQQILGELIDVLQTGANDVYVVKMEDGKELMLPAIRECILDVNIQTNKMYVHLLEGLMELLS